MNKRDMYNTIIIGGGVSGIVAAGVIASSGVKVLILEKKEKPARKLRITGKGRCNITNLSPIDNHLDKLKTDKEFMRYALENYEPLKIVEFLNKIGVATITERGNRVYPKSDSAVMFATQLVEWAKKCGVEIVCNSKVNEIRKDIIKDESSNFKIVCDGYSYHSQNVVLACGGASYPATGSSGDGYSLAYNLGHNIIAVRPSLVHLISNFSKTLLGLKLKNTTVKLVVNNVVEQERFGEMEFNERGVAGATVLQISRYAVDAIIDKKKVCLSLDLKPALTIEKLQNRVKREMQGSDNITFKMLLDRLLPRQLHPVILSQSGVLVQSGLSINSKIASLTEQTITTLAQTIKDIRFEILDYGSFNFAIVTAGGVDTTQINSETMESSIVNNLYFCGEVLDIDSDTGGYNIQLALSTALLVASSISRKRE